MAGTRRTGKQAAKDAKASSAGIGRKAKSPLDHMIPRELAMVLRTLLVKHPELRSEAESIAVDAISAVSLEDTAEDVLNVVTSLGIDALYGRAGKKPWGYVEPTEAAWELLGEATEDFIADMRRLAELGQQEAAEKLCCAVVLGLRRSEGMGTDGPLGWAPDFPAEQACHAVEELLRILPVRSRRTARDHLIEALGAIVPEWSKMIMRCVDRETDRQ